MLEARADSRSFLTSVLNEESLEQYRLDVYNVS